MIRAILFDMDGVLFDSEAVAYTLFRDTFKKLGYKDIRDTFLSMLGMNSTASHAICQKAFGEAVPVEEVLEKLKNEQTQLGREGKIPLKKGVMETLTKLRESGLRTAIVSGTARYLIEIYLDAVPGMMDCFTVIVPGDLGLHSKPSPEPYLKAAELLGLEPSECIGVEDSLNGVKSLHAAGIYTVCIPDMIPYGEAYRPYVDEVLEDMNGLLPLVNRLNGRMGS